MADFFLKVSLDDLGGEGDGDDEGLDKNMEKRGGQIARVGMGTPKSGER